MKEENQAIIKALNMYGRVPEQWELLNEIERLNKIIEIKNNRIQQLLKRTRSARIDKAIEYIEEQSKFNEGCDIYKICNKDTLLEILKGE